MPATHFEFVSDLSKIRRHSKKPSFFKQHLDQGWLRCNPIHPRRLKHLTSNYHPTPHCWAPNLHRQVAYCSAARLSNLDLMNVCCNFKKSTASHHANSCGFKHSCQTKLTAKKKEFNTFLLRGARPVDKPSKRSLGPPEESETSEFLTSNHDSEQFQKISMIFIVNLIEWIYKSHRFFSVTYVPSTQKSFPGFPENEQYISSLSSSATWRFETLQGLLRSHLKFLIEKIHLDIWYYLMT